MVKRKQVFKENDTNNKTFIGNTKATKDESCVMNNEERKQMNAFHLLMESRNKSIGSNSPGKVLNNNDSAIEPNILEKKSIKVKRKLLLEKMAESKGSMKRKENESYQDECIKYKMQKRAERLKNMIVQKKITPSRKILNGSTGKQDRKSKQARKLKCENLEKVCVETDLLSEDVSVQVKGITSKEKNSLITEKKIMTEDDEAFLNKLSPSIKKKESMLSYFKKVDKSSESIDEGENSMVGDNLTLGTIKVKLSFKSKRMKNKKKNQEMPKVSVNKNANIIALKEDIENISQNKNEPIVKNSDRKTHKLKRQSLEVEQQVNKHDVIVAFDRRPRRNIKRPVKYKDDINVSSSEDEYLIFSPKKKKTTECKNADLNDDKRKNKPKDKKEKKTVIINSKKINSKNLQKKDVKLAPIFSKPQIDQATLEAKQKFLQSGVPDKLRKILEKQKHTEEKVSIVFPVVVHVQQLDSSFTNNVCEYSYKLQELNIESPKKYNGFLKDLLASSNSYCMNDMMVVPQQNVKKFLQNIKLSYPKFPVYRTYKSLRSKSKGEYANICTNDLDTSKDINNSLAGNNENPEVLNWTEKYKALSTNEIIGNFESIKEFKKWLLSWKSFDSSKKLTNDESDSSDYYKSDTDSRDSMKVSNNLLILAGPTGCGKTSSVYAVAAELAIKVIEVNASSKRTGKIMIQDLQEATQSHKVNRTKSCSTENSQTCSQEIVNFDLSKNLKKQGRTKKGKLSQSKKLTPPVNSDSLSQPNNSQESTRTGMSLILIDDADIVFEQDDGFASAISQLVQSSKRPVILVTESLTCPHLQKFIQGGKVISMHPLLPRMLGTWLDILCLADNGRCIAGVGAKLLDYFKGDIRRTINTLQFIVNSTLSTCENDQNNQNSEDIKADGDDECSSSSWVDHNGFGDNVVSNLSEKAEADFTGLQISPNSKCFNMWWTIPKQLKMAIPAKCNKLNKQQKYLNEIEELDAVANMYDNISFYDYINQSSHTYDELIANPWYMKEGHSIVEKEDWSNFSPARQITEDISCYLVENSFQITKNVLELEEKLCFLPPGMTEHRSRAKIVSRHNNVTTYLSAVVVCDKRALALDYWSACRSICRIERNRTENNLKRNNRFCHYLKSLKVMCKNEAFDALAESLN